MSETPDQAATRRRWVTLAELVAVAGVVIAALTLWNSWTERRDAQADRAQEQASKAKTGRLVHLDATATHDGETLTLADPDHKIDTIDVRFPAALHVAPQEGVPEPRIEAGWFRDALLKATDGGPDAQEGRLPVLITAYWWDADTHRGDRAIYDVVWRTEGRLLRGRALRLEDLVLRERGGSPARLDALWKRPAK